MKPTVLVTRRIPEAAIERLASACEVDANREDRGLAPNELIARAQGKAAVVCLLTDKIDAQFLESSPSVHIVANVAVGYDNIDVEAAHKRDIVVTNTPGVLTDATADFAFALLMATARRITEAERFLRAGKYKAWDMMLMLGGPVWGATLGLAGFGRIGQAMARRGRGFNMRILYTDEVRVPESVEREAGATFVNKATLLRESDFISLHVPLMEGTRHYIGEAELKMMKPTAYLINTSRGPVVDEGALGRALREGRIAGAGLDVFEEEPKVHPDLLALENVVIAPHIASATVPTRTQMAMIAADNVLAVLAGKPPLTPVK